MRWSVVSYYTGLFLRIFSVLLLVPLVVGKIGGESFVTMESFLLSAFLSIVLGWFLTREGRSERPEAMESMATATISWLLAVGIGAIPIALMAEVSFLNAYFESMSAFTTTGMTILDVSELPRSLLFWRSLAQWIGGLGILTLFVTVLVEAGGVAQRLVATEANKTSSGAIRPSLFNAIKSLWYVYVVFTLAEIVLLVVFDVPTFHAVTHSLSTLPTGGLSSVSSLDAIFNRNAKLVLTVFMFAGGTNFLLLYSLIKGDPRRLVKDFEFRMYFLVTALASLLIFVDLSLNSSGSLFSAVFHTVSVISSTGYEITPVRTFPEFSRTILVFLMFVGGSLGSTTGGIKMLRFGIMLKVARQQVRAMSLPTSVMNPVTLKRRILKDDEIVNVATIIFLWSLAIFIGGAMTVWLSPYGIAESAQIMTSAVGTMGPVYIPSAEIVNLHPLVKVSLALGMLAGRLEMLPLLALLNLRFSRKFI